MTIVAKVDERARRFGFVSFLWWLAAVTALVDTVKNHHYSTGRIVWVVITFVLAIFFTNLWRMAKKMGPPPQESAEPQNKK